MENHKNILLIMMFSCSALCSSLVPKQKMVINACDNCKTDRGICYGAAYGNYAAAVVACGGSSGCVSIAKIHLNAQLRECESFYANCWARNCY